MSTVYVDLSRVDSGDGSELTPHNFTDFTTAIDNSGQAFDVAKLKGTKAGIVNGVNWNPLNPLLIENWLPNEPWILALSKNSCGSYTFGSNSLDSHLTMRGGIVDIRATGEGQYGNVMLYCTSYSMYFHHLGYNDGLEIGRSCTPTNFYGCTFVDLSGAGVQSYGGTFAFDSIFYFNTEKSESSPTATNCAFNFPEWSGAYSISDWDAPPFPSGLSPQAEFSSTVLSVGLTTPPQPGNPPYSGYEYGLWGGARTGIGAMDFPSELVVPVRKKARTYNPSQAARGISQNRIDLYKQYLNR